MRRLWRRLAFTAFMAAALVTIWPVDHPRAQGPTEAQPYPDSMFAGLSWRSIGPNRGGRSIAVAGSAARPLEYYFGATGGGLWKTTDGGVTWQPVADKFLKTSSVGAVAVAESNPDVVYVGMGETELRGNVIQGDGVYKSTDGGQDLDARRPRRDAWPSRASASIPTNPDVVFVAALGQIRTARTRSAASSGRRTAARRGTKVLFRDDKTGAVDLVDGSEEPRRALRRALGGVPHAALAVERRARQRPVQDDRRRRRPGRS